MKDYSSIASIAQERLAISRHISPEDSRVYSYDAILFSVGCTHKKCFVGALGAWRAMPPREVDLWIILALHGAACALAYQEGMAAFLRWCTPRFNAPHTLITGCFATPSPFQMLWLWGSVFGAGADMQRSLGRLGFLALYLCGALSSVLISANLRYSATGVGGILATFACHTLTAPLARHAVFGIEMSARMALAAQVGIATLPNLSSEGSKAAVVLALNGAPLFVGAAFFQAFLSR